MICNIVLFLFTCLVLVTDGFPRETLYIVFTLWTFLTLILNLVVIASIGAGDGWLGLNKKRKGLAEQKQTADLSSTSAILRIVAIISNIVFLGFHCWSFVDQYPHPEEEGFIAYLVLVAVTPILSLVVLCRSRAGGDWLGIHQKRIASEE